MRIQNSYEESTYGRLYIVPTPIGNLEDITFRALKVLEQVDMIAAEDTRHTQKLLNHFEMKQSLISYHEHNKVQRLEQLMTKLLDGDSIALVSDAGMPAISDPGFDLVQAAIERHINVIVLPGANAALCALVGSGLPTDQFTFYGFLPRKKQEKEKALAALQYNQATTIFYESPFRVKDTVKTLEKVLGDRKIAIAREITKMYEQYVRGSITEVLTWLEEHDIKGECCLVVSGAEENMSAPQADWWKTYTIVDHVQHYEEEQALSNKDAMKQVAKDRGISRRDVYKEVHIK